MRSPPFLALTILCISSFLGGCEIFPASGPGSLDVRGAQNNPEDYPYAFVKVTQQTIDVLESVTPSLSRSFADRRPPKEIRLGVGDSVGVSIFEAGAGGLFIPAEAGVRPGNFISLPTQAVDNNGNISIPYSPPIRAAGRTTTEVQKAIVEALKSRAIEPQVIVTLTDQKSTMVSVLGDVNAPGRLPANLGSERLIDTIARAGGPRSQGFDSWVLVEREGKRATVPFGALIYDPSNNVYTRPDDVIYLYREPQTFLAFGAPGTQGQFPFDAWRISLAEAVAKAGGLLNDKADPGAVFLYRGETREVAESLGVDCRRFQEPIIPIIYTVDLRDPSGYFLARQFAMKNKDVIYVANSLATETAKAMNYFRLVVATINDPIITAQNALVLIGLFQKSTSVLATTGASFSPGR